MRTARAGDRAVAGRIEARQDAQEGSLARPVGAHQRDASLVGDADGDAVEDIFRAKRPGEVRSVDKCHDDLWVVRDSGVDYNRGAVSGQLSAVSNNGCGMA
jgi:hypothetical protein